MHLELTREQYRTLLELVFLGNWIVTSLETEEDVETQRYDELERYIFYHAKSFGLPEYADGERPDDCYPSRRFEDESPVFDFIDEYDDQTFWEELAYRLAERDLIRQYGEEALAKLTPDERFLKKEELVNQYTDIFSETGLDNIEVKDLENT
jgi:hypothetical protein